MASLPIFQLVHTERSTYGIRSRDFSRYHIHCTRKVAEIRKKLDIVQTTGAKRGIYKKKKIEDDDSRRFDHRHILLHLFSAERAWAHAQSFPKDNSKEKHHADRIFRKAVQHASTFLALVKAHPTYSFRTKVEAQAYEYTFESQRYFNKGKATASGLVALCKTWKLLQVLAKWNEEEKGSDVGDSISLAMERQDELEIMIRFCNHQLHPSSTTSVVEIVAHEKKHQEDEEFQTLLKKADEVATSLTTSRPILTAHKSFFRGLEISVRNVEMSRALLATDNALELLGPEKERPGSKRKMGTKRMTEFDKCLSTLGNADGKAERVTKDDQGKGSSNLELAHSYITYHVLTTRILRDYLLMQDAINKLHHKEVRLTQTFAEREANEQAAAAASSTVKPSLSKRRTKQTLSARLDKAALKVYPMLIKLLNGIILSYESVRDLRIVEQDSGSTSNGISDLLGRIEAKIAESKAQRALYLGHTYRLMHKYTESVECLARGEVYVREAKRSFILSGGYATATSDQQYNILEVKEETLAKLEEAIRIGKSITARKWFEESNGDELLAKLEGEEVHSKPTFYDVARNYVIGFDLESIKEKAGLIKPKQPEPVKKEPPPPEVDLKRADTPTKGWGFFRKG